MFSTRSGAIGLFQFLHRPLDVESARGAVRTAFERRAETFLTQARDLIYRDVESPYRKLLLSAGCDHADLDAMVRSRGLEATLQSLHDAGVYVTFDEYKGFEPIVRNGLSIDAGAFDRRAKRGWLRASSSGSRSSGTEVFYDWDLIAQHAAIELLLTAEHDAMDRPLALWLPLPPGLAGIHAVLMRAKFRQKVERWFTPIERDVIGSRSISRTRMRLALRLIEVACAMHGCPIAKPEFVAVTDPAPLATWIAERVAAGTPPLVRAYVSGAVRIAAEAMRQNIDVSGTLILAGGEATTASRRAFVEQTGMKLFARYSAAEAGLIGAACRESAGADDLHVYLDRFAVISNETRLYLTTLSPHASRILFNTDIGDHGELRRERCSCEFGRIGMDVRLSSIGTSLKATQEGMSVPMAELERAAAAIVARAGGSPADFQFWQIEEPAGVFRLELAINPELQIDDDVEEALVRASSPLAAAIWRQAGTLRVVRQQPRFGGARKLPPLIRFRPGQAPPLDHGGISA